MKTKKAGTKAAKKASKTSVGGAAAGGAASGALFHVEGRMSTFGGPDDSGVGPNEGLALVEESETSLYPGFFLTPTQAGAPGLARRLNPARFYVAARWPSGLSRSFLQRATVLVANAANTRHAEARAVDRGPALFTGRAADLSPGLASFLGLETDDECSLTIEGSGPIPLGAPPAPPMGLAAFTPPAATFPWSEAAPLPGSAWGELKSTVEGLSLKLSELTGSLTSKVNMPATHMAAASIATLFSPGAKQMMQQQAQAALPALRGFAGKILRKLTLNISSKMDPRLQVACARMKMGLSSRQLSSATSSEIAVLAKVRDVAEWEKISEVRVGARVGKADDGSAIVTARIPVNRVEAVRANACVRSLKASQSVRPALAATTAEMGVGPGALPPNTSPDGGAGVVVGIVDFGGDFVHRNFRNADGSTRLLAIWNQAGNPDANSPFGYGKLYTTADINEALKQPEPYLALGYAPPVTRPDTGMHGTHVMDIAAGNGRGSGTPGCAPNADLVFVEAAANDIAWSGPEATEQSFGDSVQMLEAIRFIFDLAGDRPCVVNLSLGTNGGPHDGTTLVEQGIDAMLRAAPNRAVVIAASNSYSDGIHAAGTVPASGTDDLVWQADVGRLDRELEIWLPGAARVAVELFSPDGNSLGVVEPGDNLSLGEPNQIAIFISNRLEEPNNGDNSIGIFMAGGVDGGDWRVRLHSRNNVAAPFHAWIERQDDDQSHFPAPQDNTHTLGSISCSHEAISVASFDAHKADLPLSYFSSSGPTRDGRFKPEVSAPGHAVVAARSRSGTSTTTMSGTSMASPAVTGLVALILAEAHRRGVDLTSAQIRSALLKGARTTPPTLSPPNSWDERYGFGRAHSGSLARIGGTAPAPHAAKKATKKAAAKKATKKAAKKAAKKAPVR